MHIPPRHNHAKGIIKRRNKTPAVGRMDTAINKDDMLLPLKRLIPAGGSDLLARSNALKRINQTNGDD